MAGRYDGLAEQIGGDRVPGVGFGCGIERVVLALEDAGVEAPAPVVDWFCACEDDGRATGAARAARARARARARVSGRSRQDAASRGSCATPSGCGRAS